MPARSLSLRTGGISVLCPRLPSHLLRQGTLSLPGLSPLRNPSLQSPALHQALQCSRTGDTVAQPTYRTYPSSSAQLLGMMHSRDLRSHELGNKHRDFVPYQQYKGDRVKARVAGELEPMHHQSLHASLHSSIAQFYQCREMFENQQRKARTEFALLRWMHVQ